MKRSVMLGDILRRGYFPKELPTPFATETYAKVMKSRLGKLTEPFTYGAKGPQYRSRPFIYNVARRGTIRRPLAVPNPINFFQVAQVISDNWSALESHYRKADQTISRPVFSEKRGRRAFEWEKGYKLLAESRLNIRNASKCIVKADISNFYPSIYTHSVPWALHTKQAAKKQQRFSQSLGNRIDKIVSTGQEGQTKGLPIGPDTSFVIAELVMSSIDELIVSKLGTKFFRYIDDFEFGCSTVQQADTVIAGLQEILAEYELSLNPTKTTVTDLPLSIEPLWIHELAAFSFRDTKAGQEKDLYHYFDLSMDRRKNCEDEAVINYAIKRTSSLDIKPANWRLYESLLLQWAIAEPGVLPLSIDFLAYHQNRGATIDVDRVKETLQHIITVHAPMGHTSELAWALWGMILFRIAIDDNIVDSVADIENPVIALLCLDAKNQKLINKTYVFDRWAALMSEQELQGANWLLAYEALLKKWLPSASGHDYLGSAPGFSFLKKNKVSFYTVGRTFTYRPELKYRQLRIKRPEREEYGLSEITGVVAALSYE